MKKMILLSLVALIATIACKKKTEDVVSPVITIYSPTTAQAMHYDSVIVSFKVEDEDLHEVGFSIMRSSDDSVLYNMPAEHVHEIPFLLQDTLVVPVMMHTDAKIKVEAADHNENMSEKTVSFHIHPM